MKFLYFVFILICLVCTNEVNKDKGEIVNLNDFSYENGGRDWPGLCSTGKK